MKQFIICFALLLLLSCKKTTTYNIPDGSYQGTFQRQNSAGSGQVSNVTINFSSGDWKGQGQYPKYPALCRGTYTDTKNSVTFENLCAWTAEFDGRLILSQNYSLRISGDSLEITRVYNTGEKDIYQLSK